MRLFWGGGDSGGCLMEEWDWGFWWVASFDEWAEPNIHPSCHVCI